MWEKWLYKPGLLLPIATLNTGSSQSPQQTLALMISLIISDAEHMFMYHWYVFFGKMSTQTLCPYFKQMGVGFFFY